MAFKFSALFFLSVRNIMHRNRVWFLFAVVVFWCIFILAVTAGPGKRIPVFFHDSMSLVFMAFMLTAGMVRSQVLSNQCQPLLLRPVSRGMFFAANAAAALAVFNAMFLPPLLLHLSLGWWKGVSLPGVLHDFWTLWFPMQVFPVLGTVFSVFSSAWLNLAAPALIWLASMRIVSIHAEWEKWTESALLIFRLPGIMDFVPTVSAVASACALFFSAGLALFYIRDLHAKET